MTARGRWECGENTTLPRVSQPWGPRGLTAAQSHVGHMRARALQASSNRMGTLWGLLSGNQRGLVDEKETQP